VLLVRRPVPGSCMRFRAVSGRVESVGVPKALEI
jgi:hypothetical protein